MFFFIFFETIKNFFIHMGRPGILLYKNFFLANIKKNFYEYIDQPGTVPQKNFFAAIKKFFSQL